MYRYRISITGFVVENPTWDDAMQRDGKDDEVFVLGESRVIHTGGGQAQVQPPVSVRSRVMGDIQGFQPEERVRAGSASDEGGLRGGDKVGTSGQRRGEPRGDRIPLRLWEGVLYENMSVMVVPTIWEWDGEVSNVERIGRNFLAPFDAAGALGFDIATSDATRFISGYREFPQYVDSGVILRYSETQIGRNVVGTNIVQAHSVVGTRADRPIGMEMVEGVYRFDPWVLTVSHAMAGRVARGDMGFGPGVIRLPYVDAPALNGRYQLFLQVEELGRE